ncbi:MAG: hypothetical protein CMO80_09420 [Verrucomicrobiales bacterium]|nr:hypothetical protein [Verrucomicrobiales bacterium]
MANPSANILFTLVNDTVCMRVTGRATLTCSSDFKRLVLKMFDEGKERVIVELSECQSMDSTFLGMLSGLGMKHGNPSTPAHERAIELLNPTERVTDLIDNLGVSDYFNIVSGDLPENVQCDREVEHTESSKQQTARDCLEAHKILMELNPQNQAIFKDVVKYFEEEAGEDE